MRIFLTFASGHVGAAVAQAFLEKGHNISALARSSEKAERLQRSGVRPVVGSLLDVDSYGATAATHDVIIHTAFDYDDEGRERLDTDRIAAEALVAAAGAAQHPVHLVYTSSAFLLAGLSAEVMDESTDTGLVRSSRPRLETEQVVLTAGNTRLRTSVVRLGVVYGGASFTMDELFSSAKREGRVLYTAHPRTRWPLIYLHDAAALFVAIAERGASGIYHAVDGHPLPWRRSRSSRVEQPVAPV